MVGFQTGGSGVFGRHTPRFVEVVEQLERLGVGRFRTVQVIDAILSLAS